MKRAIILILILILIQGAYAHQPRLVSDDEVTVKNPEVSQAFYGKLAGKPVYFRVDSGSPFKLYVNILVPLSPDAEAVSVDIIRDGKVIGTLDGNLSSWSPYFEEFGGDSYFKGPEFNRTVGAGTYYLRVSNQNNRGSYVLAVGEEESFPPDEALNAIFLLPILKSEVFGVPVLLNLLQFLGMAMGMGSFLVLLLLSWRGYLSEEEHRDIRWILWAGIFLIVTGWIPTHLRNPLNIMGNLINLSLILIIILTWRFDKGLPEHSKFRESVLLASWIILLILRASIVNW
ncbi:MAG TPA: hypothetical protein HA285_00015 [Methanothermobacter thermautotrophicus]|jgi:hypothetical protein|uniref:Uncharacterized protein n=1 Tax=Methanothermobacter thermautotrophicus TaxID=145262 RepID=A0A7J4MTC5_METTF|nr:hypothetical protein [Methanothermobacter thermautotrophicus]